VLCFFTYRPHSRLHPGHWLPGWLIDRSGGHLAGSKNDSKDCHSWESRTR